MPVRPVLQLPLSYGETLIDQIFFPKTSPLVEATGLTRAWPLRRYVTYCKQSLVDANMSRKNPPLYLHVTSTTKEGLEKAVAKIEELMKQELPQLVDERRFRRRDQEQQQVERDEFGRVSPAEPPIVHIRLLTL